jgi:hypothetical protein
MASDVYDAYYSKEQAKRAGAWEYMGILGSWKEIIATELILSGSEAKPTCQDARFIGQTSLNNVVRQVEFPECSIL